MIKHIAHTNTNYNFHIDGATLGTTIQKNALTLTSRLIIVSVTHELGHATHIHHHHGIDARASYGGDEYCPTRYWIDPDGNDDRLPFCTTHNDWTMAFLAMAWNPVAGLPDGKPYQLCTSVDDCFHQLALKKR